MRRRGRTNVPCSRGGVRGLSRGTPCGERSVGGQCRRLGAGVWFARNRLASTDRCRKRSPRGCAYLRCPASARRGGFGNVHYLSAGARRVGGDALASSERMAAALSRALRAIRDSQRSPVENEAGDRRAEAALLHRYARVLFSSVSCRAADRGQSARAPRSRHPGRTRADLSATRFPCAAANHWAISRQRVSASTASTVVNASEPHHGGVG